MSVWPFGDGFRPASAQSRDLLKSWNNNEEIENSKTAAAPAADWATSNGFGPSSDWAASNSLVNDLQRTHSPILPSMELEQSAPNAGTFPQELKTTELAREIEVKASENPVSERMELSIERVDSHAAFNKYVPIKDTSVSPLTRVNQILEEHSETSRWLNQRGYLESFKSPNCVLDLSFSTEKTVLKVGAVLNAPDGSKRTVVACDDGTSFQRITGPRGQEIVRFMSNGQIVEFGKRSGEMLRPKTTSELLKPKTSELLKPKRTSEFERIV